MNLFYIGKYSHIDNRQHFRPYMGSQPYTSEKFLRHELKSLGVRFI